MQPNSQNLRRILFLACSLLSSCFQNSTPQHSAFLPLDYQTAFQQIIPCAPDTNHGSSNGYMLVRAGPIAAVTQWQAGNYPLLTGSVFVGEEHDESSCNSLQRIYVMYKDQPSYDSASNDWHWQHLDANQRVLEDGHVVTCTSCHTKCSATDFLCSPY